MGAIKLENFGGMIPAVDDRLLPDNASAHSENTWLYSGRLAGIPQPELVRALPANTGKVFRIPNDYTSSDHLDDSTWLEFEDPDTDVIRALVIGDQFDRYYWTSTGVEPRYNTKARIANGDQYFKLGIPANTSPSVVVVGGVAANVSRAYLTTWVSAYGEEGPASTPFLITGKPDGSWNLTISGAATADKGGVGADRNLTKTRIYRTVTSSGGVATYFLVAEIDINTLVYSDILSDAVVASNSIIQSIDWTAPPDDLAGFITMPNGIIAGWRANEIWFCEPYHPHAWPAAYTVVVDFPIVGLGVTNQTAIACTQGYPVACTGIHPASMALSKSPSLEPCLSRGSILSTTEGVYYASPNGLIGAAAGSITNITKNLITKDKWQVLTTISTLRAARFGAAYYAFGSVQFGVFEPTAFEETAFAQEDFEGAHSGVLIDPFDQRVGFNLLSDTTPVISAQNDPWSGEILIIKGDNLYRIALEEVDPTRRVFKWRSKVFQVPKPGNLAALKVYWDVPASTPDVEIAAPAIESLVEFPRLPDGSVYGVVRLYADGALVWTRELVRSGELMRLPSGFKNDYFQLEFETFVSIFSVQIGTSAKGLARA